MIYNLQYIKELKLAVGSPEIVYSSGQDLGP